ncbi:unnamed protein product, partial [Prorocentrum cordatum]
APAPVEFDYSALAGELVRKQQGLDTTIDLMSAQLQWALECKIAFRNMPKSLVEAANYYAKIQLCPDQHGDVFGAVQRRALDKHAVVFDSAMDLMLADRIAQLRASGQFYGAGFTTDESPPEAPRFRGLRFQITHIYFCTFPPAEEWAQAKYDAKHPIQVTKRLLDIMHCPKKDGQSVLNVLEKQWETVGMNRYDFFSGSGDGGGENEGAGGIHATMEDVSHSYVRRRCLGHWGWRNAGAAMSEDEKLVSEVQ